MFLASGFDTVIARALTDIPNLIALTGAYARKASA